VQSEESLKGVGKLTHLPKYKVGQRVRALHAISFSGRAVADKGETGTIVKVTIDSPFGMYPVQFSSGIYPVFVAPAFNAAVEAIS
jgi:hypothetical protein